MADYFQKHDKNPYGEVFWNVPEAKQGIVNVIGGNAQSFRTVVRTAEFLAAEFPLAAVNVVLPAALQGKAPELPNFHFLPATEAGSFSGDGLAETLASADANLAIGDFSKNAATTRALTAAFGAASKPTLLTRDAVDLVAEAGPEALLLNANVSFLASAPQLQKLLRAVLYPKMMTLSQSLLQVAETLHKFTLSYAAGIITLYSGQILVAKDGAVEAVALENSTFSPLTLWGGQFASRLVALNLYTPGKFVPVGVAAAFGK